MSRLNISMILINGERLINTKKALITYIRTCYVIGAYLCVTKIFKLNEIIQQLHIYDIINNTISKRTIIKSVFNNFRCYLEQILENEISVREVRVYNKVYTLLDKFDNNEKIKYWQKAVNLLCNAKKSKFTEKVLNKLYERTISHPDHSTEDFYEMQETLISHLNRISNDRINSIINDNAANSEFKMKFPTVMKEIIYMYYLWNKKSEKRKRDFEKFWDALLLLSNDIPKIKNCLKLKERLFYQRTDHKRQQNLVITATLIALYVVIYGKRATEYLITQTSVSSSKKKKKNEDIIMRTLIRSIKVKSSHHHSTQNRQSSQTKKRKTNHETNQKSKKNKYDMYFGQSEINLEKLDVKDMLIIPRKKNVMKGQNIPQPRLYATFGKDNRKVCLKEMTHFPFGRHQACIDALKNKFGLPSLNVKRCLYDYTFDLNNWKMRRSTSYSIYIVTNDIDLIPLNMCTSRVFCNQRLIKALCRLLLYRIFLGIPETDQYSILLCEEKDEFYSTNENEMGKQRLKKDQNYMDQGTETIFHFLVIKCRLSVSVLYQCVKEIWNENIKRERMMHVSKYMNYYGIIGDDYNHRIKIIENNGALLFIVCLNIYIKYKKTRDNAHL